MSVTREGWEVIVDGDTAVVRAVNPGDTAKVAGEIVAVLGKRVRTVSDGAVLGFAFPASELSRFAEQDKQEVDEAPRKRGRPRKKPPVEEIALVVSDG